MSKAFTREQDGDDDDSQSEIPSPKLPAGSKNYITPAGISRLRSELKELIDKVRPELTKVVAWAASNGDRSENADYIYGKKRLREIDRRIRFLTKRIEAAEVVDPVTIQSDTVRFGATVTVRDEEGNVKTYSIVGVDEIDIAKGRISWISPLGMTLKNKAGDTVVFRSPKGETDLEIIQIQYSAIE